MKGIYHLTDVGISGGVILNEVLKKYGVSVWTGFIRLSIGASGGLF
jgi:hypothetical protein